MVSIDIGVNAELHAEDFCIDFGPSKQLADEGADSYHLLFQIVGEGGGINIFLVVKALVCCQLVDGLLGMFDCGREDF